MLIDCSYFTEGSRHILNATMGTADTLPNPNADEVNNAILAYIEELQPEFLTEMLGATVANKVNAYLVCQEEDETPPHVERMDELCERLREPFADYVFFHILRDSNTQATMTGLVKLKSANTIVAPISRQVSVWNSMVRKNRLFAEWSKESTLNGITVSAELTTPINVLNL